MREELTEKHFFHKRTLLIVEDVELNRELLAELLEEEYDILMAENGEEGLSLLSKRYKEIAAVLLDVYMPVCDGFEFLRRVKADSLLAHVPVIVTTGSDKREDEVRCLDLGAIDFVTKPYNPRVVLGRIHNIIKLRETAMTLNAVEYDSLTGVLTMQAFQHHADRLLRDNPEKTFDLLVADIQEFKLINSSFGEAKGDETLLYTSRGMRKLFPASLLTRQGDKFFCLMEADHLISDEEFDCFRDLAVADAPVPNYHLKVGYYPNVEKGQSISILCDRVVMAVNEVKRDFTRNIGFYTEEISKRRMEEQKMEAAFDSAIANEEFDVWFQPKVDCENHRVVAAEALVRWRAEDGAMISPGKFIPLFESDGLIAKLDMYVFRKVCEYQKNRMELKKRLFPISVNLSRNSIYHMNTSDEYRAIVEEYGIPVTLVPIELTETAATSGRRIVSLVRDLAQNGFAIHMDDFGSGYSSLSSLSILPFDELKLDKTLIDQVNQSRGHVIIKHIISIAQELGLKVVAEGVEHQEQVDLLTSLGCDMIQGYFFSPPKDRLHFEEYLGTEVTSVSRTILKKQ